MDGEIIAEEFYDLSVDPLNAENLIDEVEVKIKKHEFRRMLNNIIYD